VRAVHASRGNIDSVCALSRAGTRFRARIEVPQKSRRRGSAPERKCHPCYTRGPWLTGSMPGWLRQVGLIRHAFGRCSASCTTWSLNAAVWCVRVRR
jgi:hypothetical protein